ncbi:MAG: LysM peptidoglycan-binding domain-containing protein [Gammaproteobacteria bacterium]|nr:LysM peptidoglycan-binding domain-containing protein [Gammaproteobacteria bacterium]
MKNFNRTLFLPLAAAVVVAVGCSAGGPPRSTQIVPPSHSMTLTDTQPQEAEVMVAAAPATVAEVMRPDYPSSYTVVRGDTLWDISALFLRDPWRWPELWQKNPQVENPHLIYPGDRLSLHFIDGVPTLALNRTAAVAAGVKKLSPTIHKTPIANAIPTIPMDRIRPFLAQVTVVDQDLLDSSPYIISASHNRIASGVGDRIYVRDLEEEKGGVKLTVVHSSRAYQNPDNEEDILGYEMMVVAEATLRQPGDPAVMEITRSLRETGVGDRLVRKRPMIFGDIYPHLADDESEGVVLATLRGVANIGQYDIVVLNLGEDDGIDVGTVYGAFRSGDLVNDPLRDEEVRLPDERTALLLVFAVYERMSYALVMSATQEIRLGDRVTHP